jgi:hypothetical protein
MKNKLLWLLVFATTSLGISYSSFANSQNNKITACSEKDHAFPIGSPFTVDSRAISELSLINRSEIINQNSSQNFQLKTNEVIFCPVDEMSHAFSFIRVSSSNTSRSIVLFPADGEEIEPRVLPSSLVLNGQEFQTYTQISMNFNKAIKVTTSSSLMSFKRLNTTKEIPAVTLDEITPITIYYCVLNSDIPPHLDVYGPLKRNECELNGVNHLYMGKTEIINIIH